MSILKVDELQSRTSGNRITLPDVNNYPPYRNLIINGDMSIAQRGTSVTGVTGNGYYTVDRMRTLTNLGTWTLSQSTDVPTGQGFSSSFKYDCTTAEAISAGSDRMVFEHRIEGQNVQQLKYGTSSAESLTLSFWVKSNKTGTYCLEFFNQDNSRQTTQLYTIDSSNTWEKKTITISGDTSQGFTNDNNLSLGIFWWLGAGTDYTSGTRQSTWSDTDNTNRAVGQTVNLADNTANEWYITGVQLEVGTSATPFEFLPYDVNLKRCRRYYFQPEFGTEHYLNTIDSDNSYRRTNIVHPNSMRASPTGTVTTSLGGGGVHSSGKPTVSGTNKDSSAVNGDLTGNAGFARIVTLTLDAEL
jgi:hypothetical protein